MIMSQILHETYVRLKKYYLSEIQIESGILCFIWPIPTVGHHCRDSEEDWEPLEGLEQKRASRRLRI